MNSYLITVVSTVAITSLLVITLVQKPPHSPDTLTGKVEYILGHLIRRPKYEIRTFKDPIPEEILNFGSKDEVLDFIISNKELISSMYDHLKVNRKSCVAMHHFITPGEPTYNFMIVNKPDQREIEKLSFWDHNFVYKKPIPNDQWTIALFNTQIKGKSGKMYQVTETSDLCRHSNPLIKNRHSTIIADYWAVRGNSTEDDIYNMEREFMEEQACCIQRTIEEINSKSYCQ
jgi:hypothetical protein